MTVPSQNPTMATNSTTETTSRPSPVVQAADVTKVYRRGQKRGRLSGLLRSTEVPTVTAIDSVSISVEAGEIVALSGPSGSGKSTLLHLLAGLEDPTEGAVVFQGHNLRGLSDRRRTRLRLEEVGIIFQHFHLVDSLTARGNVALPLVELGVPKRKRRERATELLERVGLGDRITHRPNELSGGEQQRVAIARALSTSPTLVIADEPTGELDTESGRRVLDALERVAEDRAVVFASHDEQTLAIADRSVRLRDGRVVED